MQLLSKVVICPTLVFRAMGLRAERRIQGINDLKNTKKGDIS